MIILPKIPSEPGAELPAKPLSLTLCRDPLLLLALGFGSGCMRVAPGTWGTLVALPFCWLAQQYLSTAIYLLVCVLLVLSGFWLCGYAARTLGVHDHPGIVWDEIAGLFITMALAPAGLLWLAIGFVLFRIFDIAKPWPIGWLDRQVHGGVGIMLDDVLAGCFAWLALQLLARLIGG